MHMVWKALCKALFRQVIINDKCVDLPFAGKFRKGANQSVTFLVALDLLASGRFKFAESQYNVSPMSKSALRFHVSEALSLTAVSAAANIDRDSASSIIKMIFTQFVKLARSHQAASLSLGFGCLTVKDSALQFVNGKSGSDADEQDDTVSVNAKCVSMRDDLRSAFDNVSVMTP
jgi:hypothetical protein